MIPERLHTIYIYWSYPVKLSNRHNSAYVENECGLNYITRRYKNCRKKERNLYVGETKRSFSKRLVEHERTSSTWTRARGEKYVRFGIIENLPALDAPDLKKLLRTIESVIIWKLDDEAVGDLWNTRQTKSASFPFVLRIINRGFRGGIPKEICTREYN